MRRTVLTCFGFASFVLAPALLGSTQVGCNGAPVPGEHVIRAAEPIQGGTLDTGDSNVVSIIINSAQGLSLCSGSLIGPNLVLTAHHCVANNTSTACSANGFGAMFPATDFLVTTSYNAAATVFNSANPKLPAPDGKTWFGVSKVAVPGNDICGEDMGALTLSSSVPSSICPLIPSVDTDVSDGETYTAVGFGITTPNGQAAGTRYKVTGMDVSCAEDCGDPTMSKTGEWLGVNAASKGTCEGDSGGPALDSSNRVMGSVSRGPASQCNQTVYESYYGNATWIKAQASAAATAGGYTAAGWVTGAATSNAANGYCGGSSSSSTSSTSTSTSTSSSSSSTSTSSGSSGGPPTDCSGTDGAAGCCIGNTLYRCDSGSFLTADCTMYNATCSWNPSLNHYGCEPTNGGADPSGTYPQACGTTGSSSTTTTGPTTATSTASTSSSSSGGQGCGFTTGMAACDTCLTGSCCSQETACANDATCTSCLTAANPPASCNTNALVVAFAQCYSNSCGTPCGATSSTGSGSSSSGGAGGSTTTTGPTTATTGTTTTSTSSGFTTTTGAGGGGTTTGPATSTATGFTTTTGTGTTGVGTGAGGDTGSTGASGNNPGQSSGCSVSPAGSGSPAAPTSAAGMLVGLAFLASRRRRSSR